MRVELQHAALLEARTEVERLAETVELGVARADRVTPILLPSLVPLPAKVAWLRDQVPLLDELAALALMLDEDGDGHSAIDVPQGSWSAGRLLREAADRRFGPGFADATQLSDHDFALLVQTLGSVGQDVPEGSVMSPDELRDFIARHPDLASALQSTVLPMSGPGGELRSLTAPFMTAPGQAGPELERRRLALYDLFANLSPEDAGILAMTYPSVVGNLSGVPFAARGHANAVNVVAALADEQRQLADLREQHERNQGDWDLFGRNNDDLEGPMKDLQDRIDLYRSIISNDRTIVYFDPSGDGAIAELHGPLTARTDNVGVLVPGTTANLANYDRDLASRSRGFQNNDPTDSLSMISWMGGDLPDSVATDAPDPSFSLDLGPRLANFSRDLDLEISRSESSDARVTVAGHSYGGAVVGRSELNGLVADRVMHIESAGMGRDVDGAGDLPASQANVDRYSMTAPDDFISYTQGVQVGGIGHGADPDDFAGTVRLHTGDRVDGTPNTGISSHSGVFQQDSDAWNNMYAVFTGGEIETYRSPHYEHVYTGHGVATYQDGWNDDGDRIDIE